MPELLPMSVFARLRRLAWPAAGALALYGLPACVLAQEDTAGLRACAAVSDSTRRLACYDREMGRTPAQSARPAVAAMPAGRDHPSSSGPVQTVRAPIPPPSTQPPAPKAAAHETAARLRLPTWKMLAGGSSSQVTAHVASLERWPDAMVLHLDNGQVWQQTGRASGDLSLQEGDSVTIEEHLGSYWLSSSHVSSMKVRLRPKPQ